VRNRILDPALFRDRIVFVATTAAGTYDLRVTPLSPFTPGVLIHMTALDNILRSRAMQPAPYWVFALTTLALCLSTSWGFMMLQRQALKFGLILGGAVAYYLLAVHAFMSHAVWLQLAFPEGALAMTFGVAATVEYLTEGRQRRLLRTVFDRYMAAEVVDEIMRNPEGIKLGGEKKELTVFFSDVAGFTTISEKLQPEALVELLNEYLSAMTDIIESAGGYVDKYIGDAIVAVFGAPLEDPGHAGHAVSVALACRERLEALNATEAAFAGRRLSMRIGLNTGEALVGNIGSRRRFNYTAMGDTVNLASRLEGANKFYGTVILASEQVKQHAGEGFAWREIDLVRVVGRDQPVRLFTPGGPEAGTPEAESRRAKFAEALAEYRAGRFGPARSLFEDIADRDGVSASFVQRLRRWGDGGPPGPWDGVTDLESK